MEYAIDTSSLIEAFERSLIEPLRENERVERIVVFGFVLDELELLVQAGGTRGRRARGAAALARQTLKVVREPAAESHVDDALLIAASKHGFGIVSQDHALIGRAKDRGIATLTLTRSGKLGD